MQETREQRLAEFLTALLRRWVEGDHAGFLVRHLMPRWTPGCHSTLTRAHCLQLWQCESVARKHLVALVWLFTARAASLTPGLWAGHTVQESMGVEARELAQASWGIMMLSAIGGVYRLQGEIGGGNVVNGLLATMRQRGQTVKTHASMAMLAVKARLCRALALVVDPIPGSGNM